jgi:hypothetical protein
MVSLCRAVAPFIGGSVLSWGMSGHQPFPFNAYFPFLMVSATSLLALFLTCWLPESLNVPLKSIARITSEGEIESNEEERNEEGGGEKKENQMKEGECEEKEEDVGEGS